MEVLYNHVIPAVATLVLAASPIFVNEYFSRRKARKQREQALVEREVMVAKTGRR